MKKKGKHQTIMKRQNKKAPEEQMEQAREVMLKTMLMAKKQTYGIWMFDTVDISGLEINDLKWYENGFDMGLEMFMDILRSYICEDWKLKILLGLDGLFKIKLVRECFNPKDETTTIYNISNFFNADMPGILSTDDKQIVAICNAENLNAVVLSALAHAEQVDWFACVGNNHRVC